jgi:Zn-finger nucleic acid-binding protein
MNCPNCGAAMRLSAKGIFVCAHCGTNELPEAGAVDKGGVRILGPSDSSLRCALCKTPFMCGLVDDYQVEYCETCHGILLDRRDFAELVQRRRAWAVTASVIPTPASVDELRRKIACAKCGLQMTTDWYYGPGNVVIDRCTACDLVWLDYGELKQIIDAPGIDRGSHDLS